MKILVTRPKGDAEDFAADLEKAGHEAIFAPMLEIVPVYFEVPILDRYQALVFTSANGVREYARKIPNRTFLIFTVGAQTAEAAREAGFQNVMNADGDAADLVTLIKSHVPKPGLPFLHIRGDHVTRALDEMLQQDGYKVETLEVYASRKIPVLETDALVLIAQGDLDAVTFFSKRTAENFLALIEKNGLSEKLIGIKALCLGDSMLECVQPSLWAGVYAARTPNREGMLALIAENLAAAANPKAKMRARDMTITDPNTVIPDAEKIIERFGGIRPMANKMEIPVTTVQGWKKRNAIPATRRDDIVAAARIHNVQISDLIDVNVANENSFSRPAASVLPSAGPAPAHTFNPTHIRPAAVAPVDASADGLEARLAQISRMAVTRSTMINAGLIILSLGAVIALLWPATKQTEQHLQVVEAQVDDVKQQQSSLRDMIPADLQEKITALQTQAQNAQAGVTTALNQAETISNDVLSKDAGTLDERISRLESHINDLGGSPKMIEVLERVRSLQATPSGQAQLDEVVKSLSGFLGTTQDPKQIDQKLEEARVQNAAVGQTFADVPATDLKAAALLVGLSQFRETLNRDNTPFNDDLQLLTKLVGKDNPDLSASLEKLAPQAEKGVLTPEGLSTEFKGLTGDIVVSSLKGEDVSIQEKAKARMNELLSVEKDGQMITGTDTQATVARAQSFLTQGDVEGAIGQVQTLDGPAATAAAPWLDQAKATLLAQKVKQMVTQTITMHAGGITAGGIGAGTSLIPGAGSELIQDKASGINILKPAPSLPRQ